MVLLASICTDEKIMTIIRLIKILMQLMQIIIPIALIVLGSLDFGKAVVAFDEGVIKKAQKKFVNRCIAAVLVFLSAMIVRTAMGFVGNTAWQECWDATTTVKPVTCNYARSTGTITITYGNGRITYNAPSCLESSGLNVSDFSNSCPTVLYYKLDNQGSVDGAHCTFTTTKPPTTGYSKLILTSSTKASETDDQENNSNVNEEGYEGGVSPDGNTHSSSSGKF